MSSENVTGMEAPEEEILGVKKAEIRESTISEYRKGQIVRLVDVAFIGPVCVYAALKYRKVMPKWLSISLGVIGVATIYYNAKNFWVNWQQDGKLIKEALKKRKEEKDGEKANEVKENIKTSMAWVKTVVDHPSQPPIQDAEVISEDKNIVIGDTTSEGVIETDKDVVEEINQPPSEREPSKTIVEEGLSLKITNDVPEQPQEENNTVSKEQKSNAGTEEAITDTQAAASVEPKPSTTKETIEVL